MKRLKKHVPQHFTVTFCLCRVYHFYRDAILRHQKTQNGFTNICMKSTLTPTQSLGILYYLRWLYRTNDKHYWLNSPQPGRLWRVTPTLTPRIWRLQRQHQPLR